MRLYNRPPEGVLVDELNALLASLPNASLITVTMRQKALDAARIPDAGGRYPGTEGYTPTYDPYYAALTLLGFLQAQPVVVSAGSEGTSVNVQPPDWGALATYYRSLSVVVAASSSGPLSVALIPDTPHVVRTDMRGRGHSYGDVNTDIG